MCIESRTGANDVRRAQRNGVDGFQAERLWRGREEARTRPRPF